MIAPARIFLSYARQDRDTVENLYQKLSDAGLRPWMDKDILAGEVWKSSIQRAVQSSHFFLACLSKNSVSKRGYLQKEIKFALDIWQGMLEEDIYLIPVRLEDCEVPVSLREFQWVNLFEPDGWERLVNAIRVGMERRGEVIQPIDQESGPSAPDSVHEEVPPEDMIMPEVDGHLPDVYALYEDGLSQLLDRIGQDHPGYPEALVYRQRLTENIAQSRRYGDTATRKAERAEIIDQLNAFALPALGVSFSDLCGLSLSTTGQEPPEHLQGEDAGRTTGSGAEALASGGNMAAENGQTRLGNYLIERELSVRGNTRVCLAQHKELKQQVVLKHCKALTPDDQAHIERLYQGARVAFRLRHPNVVIVHDTVGNPESGDCFAVMEYANGGTLADLIKSQGRLTLESALDIGIQACTALEHIHRKHIVHGNIKPSNILLFHDDGQVVAKIADFGPPREAADGRDDLYSLGAVLYEMLAGRPPSGDIIPPRELRPAVFSELNELILTALAKAPSRQFQDAKAMLNDLREARNLCEGYHEQAEKLCNQGVNYERQGKLREAIRAFKGAYDLAPEMGDVKQRWENARLRLELENTWQGIERLLAAEAWTDALDQLEQIKKRAPEYRVEEVTKKTEYAQRQSELASLYENAQAAEKASRRQEAIRLHAQIVHKDASYKDAAKSLARLQDEENLERKWAQSEKLAQQGKWEEVVKVCKQIQEIKSDYPGATQRRDHAQHQLDLARQYAQALAALEKGNLDAAIGMLHDIALTDPGHKDVAFQLINATNQRQMQQLHQKAKQDMEAHRWPEAEKTLEELLRLDPDNKEAQEQHDHVQQWQKFVDLYRRGKDDYRAQQWDDAIAKFEEALKIVEAANLDIYNYRDIRSQLSEAKTNQQRQRAMANRVNIARRVVFSSLAIFLVAVLLLVFAPRLVKEVRQQLGPGSLFVTPEFLGAVVNVFGLIISVIGLLIPTENLYELLKKDKRLRVCVLLVVSLVVVCLIIFMVMALVPEVAPLGMPTPAPETLCNGDFEDNFECWQHGGELDQVVKCEGGQCYAVLGDPHYKCEGGVPVGEAWIKQSFQVPQTVTPTLSLRYRVFSYDTLVSDFLQVSIGGKPVGRFGNAEWAGSSCSREVWDSGWQSVEFDLGSYVGQKVEVSFSNVNGAPEWWNTWTYVDDAEVR